MPSKRLNPVLVAASSMRIPWNSLKLRSHSGSFGGLRATWEFEEKVRMEQPACSGNSASSKAPSFSAYPMSAAAALFGKRDIAKDIFHNSWKPYWHRTIRNDVGIPQNL